MFASDPTNPNRMWYLRPPPVLGPDGKPQTAVLPQYLLWCPIAGLVGYWCKVRKVPHITSVGDVHREGEGQPVTFVPQTLHPIEAGKCMFVTAQ